MSVQLAGIRAEQGPPLAVPVSFFLTGPLALVAAGALALVRGDDGMNTIWGTTTLAAVHLGSVGLLLFVMLGALYQLLPVVAGAVVPVPRLAHAVHLLLLGGAASLVVGQGGGPPVAFAWASGLLLAALALFLVPAAVALARTRVSGPTTWGLRLALVALATLAFAGLRLAYVRTGEPTPATWATLRIAHAHLGFLPWVGGLVTAVSWQVVPMFYLAPAPPRALPWITFGALAVSLVGLGTALVVDVPEQLVPWLAMPAALAVWGAHPVWTLVALRRRGRRRKDATLWFWWLAMCVGPLCLAAGAASAWLSWAKLPLFYGMLVLFGWAGTLVHGMLTRIVPFLVWLHRCAPLVGKVPVPSARELLPDRQVAVGFATHAGTLVVGLAAIALESSIVWRAFGAGLGATGAVLLWEITSAVRRGRVTTPAPPAA